MRCIRIDQVNVAIGLVVCAVLATASTAFAGQRAIPTSQSAGSRQATTRSFATPQGAASAPPLLTAAQQFDAEDATQPSSGSKDFANMSLEDLLNVNVSSAAGLTAVDERRVPVDLTVIDARDIQQSGAKDLNHLLEDFVPNVQIIDHHSPGVSLGINGIVGDREDKFLYQVNGVTMNNRMVYGANDERDLPLLGDINTVNVVEGPASATHGAGALAGVIDTETYNGLTFQGADLKIRQGVIDEYTGAEVRFGKQFNETSGLFAYFGIANVSGANTPYYFGKSFPAKNGLPATFAGQQYAGPKANLGQPAFHAPQQKLHVSYVNGPFEFWVRNTQDGTETQPRRDIYTNTKPANLTEDQWTQGRSDENQQLTATGRLKIDLSPQLNLELLQSYDFWLTKEQREGITVGAPLRRMAENQLFSRAVADWTPDASQSLAAGVEFSHFWFHDPPLSDALDLAPVVTQRDWQTDTVSFFAEDQWKINKQWTTNLSARTDKNTYSGWLFSPRATIIFTPNDKDTFKALAGQSVRRGDDEFLFGQWERSRTIASPEKLTTYELSYDRKLSEALALNTNGFYEDYFARGWNPAALSDESLGEFQIVGCELALSYKIDSTRITLSEGVSTLVHASVPSSLGPAGQGISAAPYGYGNDLAAWAPSITKLTIAHDLTKKLTGSASVIYYSGFPGAQDYANYAATLARRPSGVPLSDPGYTTPYGPNLYLNLGLEYRVNPQVTFRVDGYNLAALVSPTLSKRNYILRQSEFSVQPASVAMSVSYSF